MSQYLSSAGVVIGAIRVNLPIFHDIKMLSDLYVRCIYSDALQTRFYHGIKHYKPCLDQSDRGTYAYCLQYRLHVPKKINRSRQKSCLVILLVLVVCGFCCLVI